MQARDLELFYQTRLGRRIWRQIRYHIQTFLDDRTRTDDRSTLLLGYCPPGLLTDGLPLTTIAVPHTIGAYAWPKAGSGNKVVVVGDEGLPFPNGTFAKIVLIHALEHTNNVQHTLREVWRVLDDEAEVLVITPNRRGVWSRSDHTPFGQGTPYTMSQLTKLLQEVCFEPVGQARFGYFLPSHNAIVALSGTLLEILGHTCCQKFSGFICIRAKKHTYMGTPVGATYGWRPATIPTPT